MTILKTVCDMIELTTTDVIYHRLTGTAPDKILLAPSWCKKKWQGTECDQDRA